MPSPVHSEPGRWLLRELELRQLRLQVEVPPCSQAPRVPLQQSGSGLLVQLRLLAQLVRPLQRSAERLVAELGPARPKPARAVLRPEALSERRQPPREQPGQQQLLRGQPARLREPERPAPAAVRLQLVLRWGGRPVRQPVQPLEPP